MNTAPLIITGAGQRLGFELAKHLIQRGPVVVSYRTYRTQIETLKQLGVDCIQADFNDENGVETFIATVGEKYPAIAGIIHNASAWLPESDHTPAHETLAAMLKIHTETPYLLNLGLEKQLAAFHEQSQKRAKVIHITDYVVETGSAKHIAYAASKAALDNMSKSFAKKYHAFATVNAIAPALIIFNTHDSDAYKEKARNKSLLKTEGGVKSYLDTINLLLETPYITGRTLSLDGGRHLV